MTKNAINRCHYVMHATPRGQFLCKIGALTKDEKDVKKKATDTNLYMAEIKQSPWRKYRDAAQEVLATVRQWKKAVKCRVG